MSESDQPEDAKPRELRQSVLLGARIVGFGGGAPTQHRIKDLSSRGARVDRAGSLRVGATVLVSVGILEEAGATIVWVNGDIAGLRFAEAIDPECARSKTILPSGGQAGKAPQESDGQLRGTPPLGAGWVTDLDNAYRK